MGDGSVNVQAGMIGLGNMGRPMALSILRAGLRLGVADVDQAALDYLAAAGAAAYSSVSELAHDSDVLGIVVVNDAQVESLIYAEQGILAGIRPGSVVLVHSTVRPETCQRASEALAERGASLLDAPVSGAEMAAKRGELSVMIGGDQDALGKAMIVLQAVASKIFHVGDVGSGQVMKIANNLMAGVNMQVLRESLRLARTAGISTEKFIEVAAASSGDSWAVRTWTAMLHAAADHPHGTGALAELGLKDLRYAVELGAAMKVSLPHAALATQLHDGLLVPEEA
jgi:3-hydroxyisobutyrate dehydrogenase-like beta-hydroxyacid dehydrogenase